MLSKEQLNQIKFTNLVQHSHWTIPMGIGHVKKQIQGTIKKGLNGFAITDNNVMSGVLETYFLSKDKDFLEKSKVDKLPIAIGARLSFTDDLENKDLSRLFSLTLFAKSMTGYKNLIYLNSISSDENHFFQSNRLSISELMEKSEDLVVGSGGINGLLGQAIVKGTGQEEDLAQIFKENFGDNFFIEIHFHPVRQHWDVGLKKYTTEQEDLQKTVNLRLIEIAKKLNIKCCLVQNSYMVEEKHYSLQSILIQNHPDYKKSGWTMDQSYYLMSVEEMYNYIKKNSEYISDDMFLEYCSNTQDILALCKDIKLEFSPALPAIKYEEHVVNIDKTYEDKLADLRKKMDGFCDLMTYVIDQSKTDISLRTTIKTIIRLNKIDWTNKIQVDRLGFELKVMQLNGVIRLCDYFLLLEDVTNYVRSVGKLRGFGRGSGGGSLLTYVMDISDVDPVKYGLLFERFLTKERIGTYFFDIIGYDFKNKEEEDLTNPYFSKLKELLNQKRMKEVNKEYLAKELEYLEFNPNVAEYVFKTQEQIKSKGEKTGNENNSTVSYCLDITDKLPKDFIKSTPTTLPDFDYDTDGRDEVKEFLVRKYGKNHVTLMGTIGTLKTKGALKDIIRQLRPLKDSNGVILKPEVSFEEVNELTKKFNLLKPTDFKTEIEFYEASIDADSNLKKWVNDNKDIDEALRMLLGNAKSTGIHAGGIVVSSRNVLEVMPMTWSFDEKMWVTQSEMGYVERSGLIKYDFLGLKTLGDLNRVLKLVNERHGTSYTLSNIPMDEEEILELFVKGATESVFQFNTDLATSILVQLKVVRSILDLAMITSIARPGPLQMGMDKTFIGRNTEKEATEFLHHSLKPILKDTYGILCIAKGSKVLTNKGQKNIEDIKSNDVVLTEDGTYQKVLFNWYKGKKETIRVRLTNGEELVCTEDHKFMTQDGWKEAGKLTKKDILKSFWVGEERTEVGNDKDWLIGLSLADGDVSGSQVNISCESKNFAKKVKRVAEKSFGLKNVKIRLHERCWKAYLGHASVGGGKGSKFNDRLNPFMKEIKDLGIHGLNCYSKRLPKNYNLAMIAGLIEGDGCLINNHIRLKNKELAYDLYLALQSYRIHSSFFEDKDGVFNISFNDWEGKIPFKIKKYNNSIMSRVHVPRSYLPKVKIANNVLLYNQTINSMKKRRPSCSIGFFKKYGIKIEENMHMHWSSVLSVKKDITREVFDLSIDKVHSFVTGGIVTKNCYQEQIIQIAKAVGDFDNDSSVSIMKALSKKQLDKVVKYKEKFIKNAQKHGYTPAKADQLWQLMESFASYGFNLSHAAAYACVSYLCMWFKKHYPAEWYSAVLSGADKDDFKILYPKWKDYIKKPDINLSKDSFVIDSENKVVMPLNAINGVGIKAVENIIKNQPYATFADFHNKIDKRQVNKATTISLIFSGVFDSMKPADCSENKWRKMLILEFLKLKYVVKKPSKAEKEQDDQFIKDVANMNRGAMLMKEISLLNFTAFNYFEYYKDKMTDGARQKFGYEAITPGKVAEYPDSSIVVVGGSIEEITIAPVKNPKSKIFGQEMARIKLGNAGETIEVVLFPRQLQDDDKAGGMIRQLQEYTPIVIKGRVSRFGGGLSLTYEAGWILV